MIPEWLAPLLWRAYQDATLATVRIEWTSLKPEVQEEFREYARIVINRDKRGARIYGSTEAQQDKAAYEAERWWRYPA